MKVIGLTGGIASGKSTASAYLNQLGAAIVDTDALSRAATAKDGRGYEAVVARFGREILRQDGEIDRGKLGRMVFADEEKRRALNAILHPIVIEQSMEAIEKSREQGCRVCILDVPLLFETGMERLCDLTWLVYVPMEEQVRRVMERDGLDEASARARIASQMPLEEKMRRADVAINTSGCMEQTQRTLKALWEGLQ